MLMRSSNSGEDFAEEGRLLDGFLLLAAGGSDSPDDVISVNLSSMQLVDVATEDLVFFKNLDRLDVSDNQLSFEQVLIQLGVLQQLGSLVLACNSISSLQVNPETLQNLQSLDMSFNELHGDVLASLSQLSNLVTLNLCSNCISSVPPEEDLCGFESLEELILDANDLVQFLQWRALDALPRLRKLSLASNRVKRLKDDVPDTPTMDSISYFPALEELDLSSNEIMGLDSLPATGLFRRLRVLHLSDNPCTRGPAPLPVLRLPGVQVVVQQNKPYYLKTSGASQGRITKKESKLKLSGQKLRKVRSEKKLAGLTANRNVGTVLGVLDEEVNQLLAAMRSGAIQDEDRGALQVARTSPSPVLDDDLSEEELSRVLKQRAAAIYEKFNEPVDEPSSFMRPLPSELNSAAPALRAAGVKLGLISPEDEHAGTPVASKQEPRRSSAALFLTAVGEDAGAGAGAEGGTGRTGASRGSERGGPEKLRRQSSFADAPSSRGHHSRATVQIDSEALQKAAVLPPITPGSRGSTASSGGRRLGELGQAAVPDVGVREAIRALRAAAMSSYAVAA